MVSLFLQNKCVRYWPEDGQTKDYGRVRVRNLLESSTADYTLREFTVSRIQPLADQQSNNIILMAHPVENEERKVYHYHFQV